MPVRLPLTRGQRRTPVQSSTSRHDAWQAGDAYESYMGRWSRQIAPAFLAWLDAPQDLAWLEVGCGTGRSEEHTSELQSLMRISYAVFCLKKKNKHKKKA